MVARAEDDRMAAPPRRKMTTEHQWFIDSRFDYGSGDFNNVGAGWPAVFRLSSGQRYQRGGATMKRAIAGLWIIAGVFLFAPTARAEIKVGIVVSASGPGSALGQPQMHAIPALPTEIAGEKVVYIPLDDESDPTKGAQNARRLVIQDGVDILIGSSLTPVTMTMLDVALESKTPIISLAAATAIVIFYALSPAPITDAAMAAAKSLF